MARRRSWPNIIARLNAKPQSRVRLRMGSPGSAQATRCRLLNEWNNLEAWTVGPLLYLQLKK